MTDPYQVVATKVGGLRIEDLPAGLGWHFARQLVNTVTRELAEKRKG
jgi:hypothetical protein